ncbi:group 1 glycosyl transferase [Nitzschia inconspicua]|uniref:Group 1 glycosyl transferase n=1 Tax=Nitzschia inconspicua TaxID=303405 RepID=A0A9K3PMQ1_9STRA|nr:group 1 glycosyl transferase [Nitzschia inconspicua]
MKFSLFFSILIVAIVAVSTAAFHTVTELTTNSKMCSDRKIPHRKSSSTQLEMKRLLYNSNSNTNDAPPLKRNPPRRVCLMVEPTPFTHVSGYANRFKEMLKFMSKAGDEVDILTVDSMTPADQLPKTFLGYRIQHTLGFTFPLYNQISLTLDLPEMKGATMLEKFKPDLIHVTSPGFMLFAALFYARVMCIPLVMSYHTHLPSYAVNYLNFIPGIEYMSWEALRFVHSRADLTLVTSPQMKEELKKHGIPRVEVWRKGIDTERFDPKFKSDEMRKKMSTVD